MGKVQLCALMVCAILTNVVGVANETAPFAGQTIDGKLYVEPGTVHVAPNGIFLNLDGDFVPVNAVCMDEGGIYVVGYELKTMVYCTKCGRTYNADRYSSKCPHTDQWCQYPS